MRLRRSQLLPAGLGQGQVLGQPPPPPSVRGLGEQTADLVESSGTRPGA